MITSYDIKDPLTNIIRTINSRKRNVQSILLAHGSSSKIDRKFYVSDIDVEYWIRFQNNKKDIYEHILDTVNFLIKNNMYYHDFIAGVDDRFEFNIDIKKDGSMIGYDYKKIKNEINKMKKDKIISNDEYKDINKFIVKDPDIIIFNKLRVLLRDLKDIHWTYDELISGKKIVRGKTFILYDLLMKSVFRSSFVYEYKKNNYVLFDYAFRIFFMDEKYETLKPPPNVRQYDFIINYTKIYGEVSRRTTNFYYESLFRNYVQGKYLKMIKRIRSLFGEYIFRYDIKNNINKNINKHFKDIKYRIFLLNIRKEIEQFTKNVKISCLNQLKNRIEGIIILTKYKEELEIKRLTIELLNDCKNTCGYYPDNIDKIFNILKKYNENKLIDELTIFRKILFKHLNDISLPFLIKLYNKLEHLLPFKIVLPLP